MARSEPEPALGMLREFCADMCSDGHDLDEPTELRVDEDTA